MKKKTSASQPKAAAKKAPPKKRPDELSPEELEKVAGGLFPVNSDGRYIRRPLRG